MQHRYGKAERNCNLHKSYAPYSNRLYMKIGCQFTHNFSHVSTIQIVYQIGGFNKYFTVYCVFLVSCKFVIYFGHSSSSILCIDLCKVFMFFNFVIDNVYAISTHYAFYLLCELISTRGSLHALCMCNNLRMPFVYLNELPPLKLILFFCLFFFK